MFVFFLQPNSRGAVWALFLAVGSAQNLARQLGFGALFSFLGPIGSNFFPKGSGPVGVRNNQKFKRPQEGYKVMRRVIIDIIWRG